MQEPPSDDDESVLRVFEPLSIAESARLEQLRQKRTPVWHSEAEERLFGPLSNDFNKCSERMHIPLNENSDWCHIITQESMPELYQLVQEAARELHLKEPPQLILRDGKDRAESEAFDGNIYIDLELIRRLSNDPRLMKVVAAQEAKNIDPQLTRRLFISKATIGLVGAVSTYLVEGWHAKAGLALATLASLSRIDDIRTRKMDHHAALVTNPQDVIDTLRLLDKPKPETNNPLVLLHRYMRGPTNHSKRIKQLEKKSPSVSFEL